MHNNKYPCIAPLITRLACSFPQKYVLQTHAGKSASVLHPAAYEALSSVFHLTWELTDKDNIVISFDKYKSDITVSQDLIIGYVKDGIMYEGEVFDELSGKYSFSPDEKGEYFFYLLSGSSDYLSLKSGNLEVN